MAELLGEEFNVSPNNSQDRKDAANAAVQSRLAEEAHNKLLQNAFGPQAGRSISPERKHTYGTSKNLPISTLSRKRSRSRTDRVQFTETDGMKCAEGHIPKYDKDQLPFLSYGKDPINACLHNNPNNFLVWDPTKSKYCCQPVPDSNQTIMERSLQNIYDMVTKSDIHYKSRPYLEAAITKYLRYYDLVNNDSALLIAETEKMNTLKTNLTSDLSREHEERSLRAERAGEPLTKAEATRIFNLAYPDVVDGFQAPQGGGRSKNHNSKSRTKKPKSGKPKSKSKRTKSRKPKSRKSKRRY